jgi:hypothetical protein
MGGVYELFGRVHLLTCMSNAVFIVSRMAGTAPLSKLTVIVMKTIPTKHLCTLLAVADICGGVWVPFARREEGGVIREGELRMD